MKVRYGRVHNSDEGFEEHGPSDIALVSARLP